MPRSTRLLGAAIGLFALALAAGTAYIPAVTGPVVMMRP